MQISIFTDELGLDITEGLPIIQSWGLSQVDFRSRIFGKAIDALSAEELAQLKALLAQHEMTVGCLETSLAKIHLPDADQCRGEIAKLDGILRAADALGCRLVRSFFFWHPGGTTPERPGQLMTDAVMRAQVQAWFAPLAERAKAEGLTLAFENCGANTDDVITMLQAFGVPHWGMAWDPHNDWLCDERRANEHAYILKQVRLAKLLHVKAVGSAIPFADGTLIPYDAIIDACHNLGMPGPVSAETHNPDRTQSNLDVSQRVVEVIQRAWPSAAPSGIDDEEPVQVPRRAWEDDPVSFVVVGLGRGHEVAKRITRTPGNRLIGVCDAVEARAKRTAEACGGVPWTTDLRPWLGDERVEVVYVVTETGNHGVTAVQALNAGKHVLSTKPMEASLAACDEMIAVAEKNGRLLGIDFDRRFARDTYELKQAVADGCFGKLLSGQVSLKVLRTMEYFHANGGWRGTRRWDGGGVLSNQFIHSLDETAFTLGIPAKVRCSLWTQTHEIEAEDLGVATWLYDSGLVLTLFATTSYAQPTWYTGLELTGTDGAFFAMAGGPFEKRQTRWYQQGAWSDTPPRTVEMPWLNANDNFAAAVRTGAPLVCPGRDGRRSQAILDAMYRSAYEADGGWVEVQAEAPVGA